MKDIAVILDNIRSAHNVGAIFRTCDGAGVKKLYLCGITPYPGHQKLHKTALDAENYVAWEYFKNTKDAIEKAKGEGYRLFSVEQTDKAEEYYKVDYPQKVAVIFGHELTGVSMSALQSSDEHIVLPMIGKKNSLNVSTCVGIIVYHVQFNN